MRATLTPPTFNEQTRWRGVWSAALSYKVGDAVRYGGDAYVCTLANLGVTPNDASPQWDLIALGGAVGPQGPQGVQGVQGPIGLTGPQGIQGPIGLTGPQGSVGPQGSIGPQGLQGPQGNIGPEGDVGPAGPTGAPGAPGAAGPQGNPGPQGPVGPEGPEGDIGPTGPEGPEGDVGPQGPQGDAGPQGPAGTPATYSDDLPLALGPAAAGSIASAARGDHVHPTTGLARVAAANAFTLGPNTFNSGATGNIALIAKGHSGQTAEIFQVQNSAGTALVAVNIAGAIYTPYGFRGQFFEFNGATGPYLEMNGSVARVINRTTAGNTAFLVRGMASQTGDLLQAQNSASTVLARITSAGVIDAAGVKVGGVDVALTSHTHAAPSFTGARATSSSQSIATGTETAIIFDSETFDTSAFHDNITNNTRFTVPSDKAGKYLVRFDNAEGYTLSVGGGGYVRVRKNGATPIWDHTVKDADHPVHIACIVDLSVGDYIEITTFQQSGGSVTFTSGFAEVVLLGV